MATVVISNDPTSFNRSPHLAFSVFCLGLSQRCRLRQGERALAARARRLRRTQLGDCLVQSLPVLVGERGLEAGASARPSASAIFSVMAKTRWVEAMSSVRSGVTKP